MKIDQLIIASVKQADSEVLIDGNKYFNNLVSLKSFDGMDDIINKCKDLLNDEWNEQTIEVKHEIFDHETDINNLTYEDFVYKYGPCTHYFTNKADGNDAIFGNKNSDVTYLEKLGGELLYPEDFRKTPNKFEYGDICMVKHSGENWYGVIYKVPSSIYNLFGKEDPWFERGYFIEALNGDSILDFDHVSEYDMELVDYIPERYREFLEIFSKLFKLDIKEECFDLDTIEYLAQEYFYYTDKWKEFRDRCLEKIKEVEAN